MLKNPDWTTLDHYLELAGNRPSPIGSRIEVNELLFLWMAAIDESAGVASDGNEGGRAGEEQEALASAVAICTQALNWVEPRGPWLALRALLQSDRVQNAAVRPAAREQPGDRMSDEPRRVNDEKSALACFQWGLLCYRHGRLASAIDWLERAVHLEEKNYWYQFLLAFLEDEAGHLDEALNHYSIAAALEPESPGVRFSRARLYRARVDGTRHATTSRPHSRS